MMASYLDWKTGPAKNTSIYHYLMNGFHSNFSAKSVPLHWGLCRNNLLYAPTLRFCSVNTDFT